jgi:hypothetical protein
LVMALPMFIVLMLKHVRLKRTLPECVLSKSTAVKS